jgi:hypothetical protein
MPILMPWSTVEIGDVDVFAPALPSLVVYTWYVDDQPESTVTYFWRDENTGLVHHEIVHVGPVTFEAAVARAQEEAPKRGVERIHVKHARSSSKPESKSKAGRATKVGGMRKNASRVGRKTGTTATGGRRKQGSLKRAAGR